jgi:hypothetical protein
MEYISSNHIDLSSEAESECTSKTIILVLFETDLQRYIMGSQVTMTEDSVDIYFLFTINVRISKTCEQTLCYTIAVCKGISII